VSLPWLRLYTRILSDNKIRLLAFEDRWHYVALLCLKRTGLLDEADSDLKQRRIAVEMGLQVRELDEVFRRLAEVGLTDRGGNPIKWDDLQFESDSAAERMRKYRANKKKTANKSDGTRPLRNGDAAVTAQDKDTDTDTDYSPIPERSGSTTEVGGVKVGGGPSW
jgi:hypothetical protein